MIAFRTLREFWQRHPDSQEPLKSWLADAEKSNWRTPHDIKADHASASIVAGDRVVFNIKGNSYRVIVAVNYSHQIMLIKFVGTHSEYDQIDARTVGAPAAGTTPNKTTPKG